MPHVVTVSLGERPVGTITSVHDQNIFAFDARYLNDPAPPVLGLGFYNAERKLVNPTQVSRVRLPPFFSNLLPEGHLRQYLAARARVDPARDFSLLYLTGADLPGNVIVSHPDGFQISTEDPNEIVALTIEADSSVLKFSLAGVQLKFSAVRESDGGLTIPVHGKDGHWILKMPSATYNRVPENEYAMLLFARAVGIDVPEVHLTDPAAVHNLPPEVRSDLGRALYIKRFDRNDDRRIHIEDFNQIFQQYPADKYKYRSYGNMLAGIWAILGEIAAKEFIRRLVFNVAIGNGDMHLKNWSLIYPDGRTPQLAPAYDYLSSIVYLPGDRLALSIAGSKDWADVSHENLERFARKARVPRGVVLDAAHEMAQRIRTTWPQFKKTIDLPRADIARIDTHMKTIPLLGAVDAYGIAPKEAPGSSLDAEGQQSEIM